MIEVVFQKVRARLARPDHPRPFWFRLFGPRFCLPLAAIAFIGLRLLWVEASRPAHRQEIADAFGAVRLFLGQPYMSHDGTRFTYAATAAKGFAVFVCDTATGRTRTTYEQTAHGDFLDTCDALAGPWAPDDSAFIYTTTTNLYVCSAILDKDLAPAMIPIHGLSDLVWLNPSRFVWLEGTTLCCATREIEDRWQTRRFPQKAHIASLAAVDESTIAWLQEDFICHLSLPADLSKTKNPFLSLGEDVLVPPATNSLVLWLDASTLRLTNGEPVTTLPDLSPRGNPARPIAMPPFAMAQTLRVPSTTNPRFISRQAAHWRMQRPCTPPGPWASPVRSPVRSLP